MRRVRLRPVRALTCLLGILILLFGASSASAAPDPGSKPAASEAAKPPAPPPPEVIGVLGDSLGDGLWAGFYRVLRRNQGFTVIKKSQVSTGLALSHYYDWVEATKTITSDQKFDIAVVFLGANDQQALKHEKKWYRFGSEAWLRIYRNRIAGMIKGLKKKHLEVYWIGLPVMQKEGFDEGARFLNRLYKEAAAKAGIPYIDIRAVTAGEDGNYATHYKDIHGKTRLMRADDGVHFTMSGYIGIASHVFARMQEERAKVRRTANSAAMGRGPSSAR